MSPSEETLAELRSLRERMNGLAGRIDSGAVNPEELDAVRECCDSSAALIEELVQVANRASTDEQREEIRAELESLMRANAVLRAGALRHGAELSLNLQAVRRSAHSLKCYRPTDDAGASCDIRA